MAQPIAFQPRKADPSTELQQRLAAAPQQHAEAVLVLYDLVEEAHRQGLLDALHGAVKAKDTIISELAKYSDDPVILNTLRHVNAVGNMVGSLNPEPISAMAKEANDARDGAGKPTDPPSLWRLFRRMARPEARRGLSFVTSMLEALGRATN